MTALKTNPLPVRILRSLHRIRTHKMAGSENKGLTSRIQIPHFDPASSKISAESWIQYVQLARESAGWKLKDDNVTKEYVWSEPQTCTNAIMLLEGTANKWGVHLMKSKSPGLEKWDQFKKLFKERFIHALTLNEKMALRDLKMTASENCRDFHDRCSNNIDLFYENEWESINEDDKDTSVPPVLPWEKPGVKVDKDMLERSANFLQRTKEIELRLAFAAGLRENIKRQVLFQETDKISDILKTAQRVETGLKELKKADIAAVGIAGQNEEDDSDEAIDGVNVHAVNFKRRAKFGKQGPKAQGGAKGRSSSSGPLKCFYCLKTGHFKSNCITMKNDRKKGIFKSNVNAMAVKPKYLNGVDAEDSETDGDDGPNVNNCQTDIAQLLNFHSV